MEAVREDCSSSFLSKSCLIERVKGLEEGRQVVAASFLSEARFLGELLRDFRQRKGGASPKVGQFFLVSNL